MRWKDGADCESRTIILRSEKHELSPCKRWSTREYDSLEYHNPPVDMLVDPSVAATDARHTGTTLSARCAGSQFSGSEELIVSEVLERLSRGESGRWWGHTVVTSCESHILMLQC